MPAQSIEGNAVKFRGQELKLHRGLHRKLDTDERSQNHWANGRIMVPATFPRRKSQLLRLALLVSPSRARQYPPAPFLLRPRIRPAAHTPSRHASVSSPPRQPRSPCPAPPGARPALCKSRPASPHPTRLPRPAPFRPPFCASPAHHARCVPLNAGTAPTRSRPALPERPSQGRRKVADVC